MAGEMRELSKRGVDAEVEGRAGIVCMRYQGDGKLCDEKELGGEVRSEDVQ